MTAFSTILSIGMLPLNVLIYSRISFGSDVVNSLDWTSLGISLVVVVTAITSGLFISKVYGSQSTKIRDVANKFGNLSGLGLIIFTWLAGSPSGEPISLAGREPIFYWGTILPIVFGLLCSVIISTLANLKKPERVTVSVECVYQNTGIAMTSCLAIFPKEDIPDALAVPFWYTGMQTVFVGVYCLLAWQMGWTKAPASENIFKVLLNSYEITTEASEEDEESCDRIGANASDSTTSAGVIDTDEPQRI